MTSHPSRLHMSAQVWGLRIKDRTRGYGLATYESGVWACVTLHRVSNNWRANDSLTRWMGLYIVLPKTEIFVEGFCEKMFSLRAMSIWVFTLVEIFRHFWTSFLRSTLSSEVQLCTWLSKSDIFCQKLSGFVSGGQSWNPFSWNSPCVCDFTDFHFFKTLTDSPSSHNILKNDYQSNVNRREVMIDWKMLHFDDEKSWIIFEQRYFLNCKLQFGRVCWFI